MDQGRRRRTNGRAQGGTLLTRIVVLPNGKIKWSDLTKKQLEEEAVATFRKRYATTNPPPTPGTFPIKLDQLQPEENRWSCVGGPMDGQGIAKFLKVKKGRGKSAVEVLVPINPETFTVTTNGTITTYTFNGDAYEGN